MLVVHRSERADCLVDALGGLLEAPPGDPVVADVVAVPTRGVERWLTQRLSHRLGAGPAGGDGVCANLQFPFPGALLAQALTAATGIDPASDPWRPERSAWHLVDLLDEHVADPALAPLAEHLRAATPPGREGRSEPLRRLTVARHVAELFDRYAVHRPDLLVSWAAPDPDGRPPEDPTEAWQSHLWRLLRAHIGTPGPAERLHDAAARLRAEPELADLPERVSVFGLTRLPASQLELLSAVGSARDVHLFLLHPSAVLWKRIAAFGPPALRPRRSEDPTSRLPVNPLLRSWGRDAREMQLVLGGCPVGADAYHPVRPDPRRPPGLLQAIQADVRADRLPGQAGRKRLDPADRTLRVFSCHGRARQVEVVRDSVLHLLAADPSLELRDVVIMCPDIDAFAPLIHAAFGSAGPTPGPAGSAPAPLPELRVRLADRSLRQTNALLAVAADLLDLAGSRASASAVLDLAARPPVSRRFGFDRDDLGTIERWVAGTGVRWGMDPGHRRPWGLDLVTENTWAAGLDRLMLGAAMAEDGCREYAGTVPFDDLPSSALDLAGRLAEFVSRLGHCLDRLAGPQPAAAWIESLAAATDSLAVAAAGDEWQRDQMARILAGVAASFPGAPGRPGGPVLVLEELRSLLAERLAGRPTRANFRTGDLTVCTLVPMRSVPHRVVAIVGLDDGSFPRHPEMDGDDVLAASPLVGDRDARSEDRQLLLDAVLAAEDHLVVAYSGRDERTNRPRPPCAPLSELLDVIDATVSTGDGRPARDHVRVAHPLQSFDRRNFAAGALGDPGPWGFDRVALAGARSASAQVPSPRWLDGLLDPLPEPVVLLDHLVAFVQHPVKAFLRRRLGLYLADRDEDLADALPLELDPLEKWAIGDRLLEAVLAGVDLERALAAERRRGFAPPGALADAVLGDISSELVDLHRAVATRGLLDTAAESLEVRLDLPDGRAVVGTVGGVRSASVTTCHYSRLGAKHRLGAWVRFLALTADRPDARFQAVTIGRGNGRNTIAVATLDPVTAPASEARRWALRRLGAIVDLYDRGMREPLPLSCRSSAAWALGRKRGEGQDQLQDRVDREWRSGDRFPGEQDDPEHIEVWGPAAPTSALLSGRPAGDECGPGWAADETSRFALLARRLWDPLLDHEQLEDR